MNIGVILLSDTWAGAERVVYNLVLSMSKISGVKVTLFINDEIYNNYDINGVKRINIGRFLCSNKISSLINYYRLKRELKYLIDKEKIDVINAHMEMSYVISPNKNLFIVSHGDDIENLLKPPTFLNKIFINNKSFSVFDKCAKIISVCEWQKQKLPIKYRNKTVVIPNGVDLDVFKKRDILRRKNTILFSGRYIERKGCLEVIKVAKLLPQYEFWFVGRGPLEDKINLPNTINLGFKSTKDLVDIYNQVDLCIFPAHWEAFPLCGLEAMACGKVVIATPNGFSEYIEDGNDGVIVPSKNIDLLRKAIIRVMTDCNLRNRLEKNAIKKVQNYTWDKIARKYIDLFKSNPN